MKEDKEKKDDKDEKQEEKPVEHPPDKCFCGICGWVDCSTIPHCH